MKRKFNKGQATLEYMLYISVIVVAIVALAWIAFGVTFESGYEDMSEDTKDLFLSIQEDGSGNFALTSDLFGAFQRCSLLVSSRNLPTCSFEVHLKNPKSLLIALALAILATSAQCRYVEQRGHPLGTHPASAGRRGQARCS